MNIKQRHFIKSTEIKDLKEEISHQYNEEFVANAFPKKAKVELIESDDESQFYAINGKLTFYKLEEGYIPVLTLVLDNRVGMKTITVDQGAIKFVTINKADIMRPGITHIDSDIKKGDIVRIADEDHDRSLAIGKALFDAEDIESKESGKVVKNLHTINDSIWNLAKQFK